MSTVLVVDDEEDIRQLVAKMLRHGGFDVLEAGSATQAAEVYAERGAVDVVVTDVIMAGGTGPALAERLRLVAPDLKVLFISGGPRDRVKPTPQTAFLAKPFTIAELVGSVTELLTH
jgi:two-component system cell cycle sensor histidine kinase/response regulator CckA